MVIWPPQVIARVCLDAGFKRLAAEYAVALVLACSGGDDQMEMVDPGAVDRRRFGWWQLAPADITGATIQQLLDPRAVTRLVHDQAHTRMTLARWHPLAGTVRPDRFLEMARAAVLAPAAGVIPPAPFDVGAAVATHRAIGDRAADVMDRVNRLGHHRP